MDPTSFIFGAFVTAIIFTIIVMANRPKIEPPEIVEVEIKPSRDQRGRFVKRTLV